MHLSNREHPDSASSALILIYIGIVFVATMLMGIPLIADMVGRLAQVLAVR